MQLLEWIKESGAAEALVCELITHIPVQSFSNHDHIEGSYIQICMHICTLFTFIYMYLC